MYDRTCVFLQVYIPHVNLKIMSAHALSHPIFVGALMSVNTCNIRVMLVMGSYLV